MPMPAMRNCGKKAVQIGLNPESLERANTRQRPREGGEDKILIKPFRVSGGMLSWHSISPVLGFLNWLRNASKTFTHQEMY